MAVRVTAGRITIVAVLAVALAGVQFAPALFDAMDGSALPAQIPGSCVITTQVFVPATKGDPQPGPLVSDLPPLGPNTSILSITPDASSKWCRRACSYCPQYCTTAEKTRCLGDGAADGCAQPIEYCSSVTVKFLDEDGNPLDIGTTPVGSAPAQAVGAYFYISDDPSYDNFGSCTMTITYVTSGPGCTFTSSSQAVTSQAASSTPTSSTSTNGGSGGTGGSFASAASLSSTTSVASTSTASNASTSSTTGGTGGSSLSRSSSATSTPTSSYSISSYVPPTSASTSATPTSYASHSSGNTSSSYPSSFSSSSSSSSAGSCGDGTVDAQSGEECDDGNGNDYDACTNGCTIARCGDFLAQPLGADGVAGTPDDEQCDDGPGNTVAGPLDSTWCSMTCQRPECSNGVDQADIADGGLENIADALADAADGGCYEKICNFNSPYLPGKNSENNPCLVKKSGTPPPVSPGDQKPIGSSCTDSTQCSGYYGTSSDTVFCISDAGPDYGVCTDVGASSGLAGVRGEILLAQAGAGGANFPICIPGVCGFAVGDEAACGGAFQAEGDTCANTRVRQQCLYNSAVALGQCPGGDIVPVPIGSDYKCFEGQGPDQQLMCGPAGQWFCKCPGDNPQLWAENLVQCGPKCGDGKVDPGEKCDDGNQVNNDQCTNTCQENVGGQCTGKECQDPAAIKACAAQNNAVCQIDNKLPCVKCVPPIGGQCTGNECAQGGDAAAAAQGMECSLMPNFPCVTFIPKNSCGNGEIDTVPPQVVDEGCEVTGTAGQYCMPKGMRPDDSGTFQPSHQCYQGANCRMQNGQCGWEMTPELQRCLAENGGAAPQAALPRPSVLAAQAGDPQPAEPLVCPKDTRSCCENGSIVVKGRDPANDCQFTNCNTDLTACLTPQNRCVRGGCQGELCVPLGSTTNSECAYDPKNICYASATCEWTGSACAWRGTPELRECLSDNADSTCPTDQSCLSRGACVDQGGTVGVACGAADTNVCCGGIGPDKPVEECDDGNSVDDDACGNDCRINCSVNTDCPEGACVDGQCVDKCAAPVAMHESAGIVERAVEFLPRLMARGDFSLLP